MSHRLGTARWLIGSALGALTASFLIGLLGMLTKVLMTGNGVAYLATVLGAILAIGVAGPGCWLTLAILFRIVADRNGLAGRSLSYSRAGALWGVAHAVLALILTALQMIPALTAVSYAISLVTGTAVTSAMIYLPPAPDHIFILLGPVLAGWIAGLIFARTNRGPRDVASRLDPEGAGNTSPAA